jgi:integrase
MKITQDSISLLDVPAELVEFCTNFPGLYLQCTPTGARRFRARVKVGSKTINKTLGYFPAMSLDQAYVAMSNLMVRRSPENFILPETGALLDAMVDDTDCKSLTEFSLSVHKRLLPLLPSLAHKVTSRSVAHAVDILQRHSGLKDGTIKRLITTMAAAYSWGMIYTALKENPCQQFLDHAKRFRGNGAIFKKEERTTPRYLTKEQVRALLDSLEEKSKQYPPGHRWHPIAQERLAYTRLLLATGMRRDECRHLNIREIYDEEMTPFIFFSKSRKKNARVHNLALSPEAVEIIQSCSPSDKGLLFPNLSKQTGNAISMYFRGLNANVHALRHTVAHTLAVAGCPEEVISVVLSHATNDEGSSAVTRRYMSLDPDFRLEDQHEWLSRLPELLSA